MSKLQYYFNRARFLPFKLLISKVIYKILSFVKIRLEKLNDIFFSSDVNINIKPINTSYISITGLELLSIDIKVADYLFNKYKDHRFDLLGSGWVKNYYKSIPLGLEGYKYDMNIEPPDCKFELYGMSFVLKDYEPIDWHKDYKSGYRWNDNLWYKDISKYIGNNLGADVKVPWELARMQHLPQLAIFATIIPEIKNQCIIEFRNQVIDFLAQNKPRFGVNWACTMDVGIRAANLLVAYDLFKQIDTSSILDDNFHRAFTYSIYQHGVHIVNNLEYSETFNNNHYLSDIAGLLFIASYLETTEETLIWLAFAIQEIINEMRNEFYDDGGNFESSTSYHRLSGELMVYSVALILGLSEEKVERLKFYKHSLWKQKPKLKPYKEQDYFINAKNQIELPQWFVNRLYKIGRFTLDIMKPDGEVPQFGDNDSGKFFKFSPNGEFITNEEAEKKYLNLKGYLQNLKLNKIEENEKSLFWDENILNHKTITSCFAYLFEDNLFTATFPLESSLIRVLANNRKLVPKEKNYKSISLLKNYNSEKCNLYQNEIVFEFDKKLENIKFITYPESGIYICRNELFYLAICITPLGQNNHGGHTHNDKLSFELWYNNKNLVYDPGTYIYTAIPNKRNLFRSVKAHNTPIINEKEPYSWLDGVTGVHFLQQTISDLLDAIGKFEAKIDHFDPKTVRENAIRFSRKRFENQIKDFIEEKYEIFKNSSLH